MPEPTDRATPELPVARVAVDVSLSHLDRPFDYAVTDDQDGDAQVGVRVRVRFAGRLCDGFVLERTAASEHQGKLTPLHKVVSAEPVLTPEIARLVRAVADHCGGCFADVLRLAVPPRHAATERAERRSHRLVTATSPGPGPLADYPSGQMLLAALRSGGSPRAYWQVTPSTAPSGDWAAGLALAARATADNGRGSVLVVPDHRDLDHLRAACVDVLGPAGFVELTAETGPAARYRAFLSALRGEVSVVIGNRAAAFAPIADLGLLALWDDGDDLLAEPRTPYPHGRTVLALRTAQTGSALLIAGYGRTAEVQQWLDRGWMRELAADRTTVRHTAPRVRVTADSEASLHRDAAARTARVPHEVFEFVRAALPQGPVLVQVPRAGYLVSLVCQTCREPARCGWCKGPTRSDRGVVGCAWCGRLYTDWECPICGGRILRAPIVGADRTAEELGKAFPGTLVRQSGAGRMLATVAAEPALVVATPGAEPRADAGYAGAVLLDTHLLMLRADLRAGEEALRRWLNVVALVRPGSDGGSVIAVGDSSARPLQALVRIDASGFAGRELADRSEAGFPPAIRLVTIEGVPQAVADFQRLLRLPSDAEPLGPVEVPVAARSDGASGLPEAGEGRVRLTVRAPRSHGAALVRAVKDATAVRSAAKDDGVLRIRVDPIEIA